MIALQLACAAIVVGYAAMVLRTSTDRGRWLRRVALISVAAWVGEDSCIRLYHFYSYAPGWSLFVDRVPLAIVVIWPMVVVSSGDLARRLVGERGFPVPLATALLVLADASLIEPIAVRAGLWSWTSPGLFHVPPVGVLGWAFFAFAVELFADRGLLVVVLAPLTAHALLVASWWGALRWLSRDLPEWSGPSRAWLLALPVTVLAWRRKGPLPIAQLLQRGPAAAFFFALLALHARHFPALIAWTLAFAPPYLALLARWVLTSSRSTVHTFAPQRADVAQLVEQRFRKP